MRQYFVKDALPAFERARKLNRQIRRAAKRQGKQNFYKTEEWLRLRYDVLQERGAKCECCGATRHTGAVIHVDHVKPIYTHPELKLSKANLQVLCHQCNIGKSARFTTDWRTTPRTTVRQLRLADSGGSYNPPVHAFTTRSGRGATAGTMGLTPPATDEG